MRCHSESMGLLAQSFPHNMLVAPRFKLAVRHLASVCVLLCAVLTLKREHFPQGGRLCRNFYG